MLTRQSGVVVSRAPGGWALASRSYIPSREKPTGARKARLVCETQGHGTGPWLARLREQLARSEQSKPSAPWSPEPRGQGPRGPRQCRACLCSVAAEDGTKPAAAAGRVCQTGGSGGPGLGDRPAGALRQRPQAGLEAAPAGALEHAEAAGLVLQPALDRLEVALAREFRRLGVRLVGDPRGREPGAAAERPPQGPQLAGLAAADLLRGAAAAAGEPLAPPHQAEVVRRGLQAGRLPLAPRMGAGPHPRRTGVLSQVSTCPVFLPAGTSRETFTFTQPVTYAGTLPATSTFHGRVNATAPGFICAPAFLNLDVKIKRFGPPFPPSGN